MLPAWPAARSLSLFLRPRSTTGGGSSRSSGRRPGNSSAAEARGAPTGSGSAEAGGGSGAGTGRSGTGRVSGAGPGRRARREDAAGEAAAGTTEEGKGGPEDVRAVPAPRDCGVSPAPGALCPAGSRARPGKLRGPFPGREARSGGVAAAGAGGSGGAGPLPARRAPLPAAGSLRGGGLAVPRRGSGAGEAEAAAAPCAGPALGGAGAAASPRGVAWPRAPTGVVGATSASCRRVPGC